MKKGQIIIDCFDSGEKNFDRYTIAISGLMEVNGEKYTYYIGASEHPFSPGGFGQHCNEMKADFFKGSHKHFGKRIEFLDLPEDVQKFVACELLPS